MLRSYFNQVVYKFLNTLTFYMFQTFLHFVYVCKQGHTFWKVIENFMKQYIRRSKLESSQYEIQNLYNSWNFSIVFGYIYLVQSRDLNIELLTISTDNIWKLCGLYITKEYFNSTRNPFIERDRTNIPERKRTFTTRYLTLNIDRQASYDLLN